MSVLVLAEHDNTAIKSATLNTVTAATKLDQQVVVLVAGHQCAGAAESATKIEGVSKVLVADAAYYAHPLAENLANLVVMLAQGYTHILAPATTSGKNVMPRVAALLDVAQISDIVAIESADTFVRPIYAGNVLATVPEGTEGRDRPLTRLQMMEEAAGMGEITDIEAALAGNPDDLELRYQAAVVDAVSDRYEASLDHAMHILQKDRKFRDDIGRTTLVRIFALLPKGSDLAKSYRRRMFALMH